MPEIEDLRLHATPIDWNIVIVGAWNVAILTPAGIASRLFELDAKTPVEVQLSIDNVLAPIKVKHEGIIVQPSSKNLAISPVDSTPKTIQLSADIAVRALNSLPETPMSAAGLNLRYRFDQIPDSLIEACNSVIDDKLSDGDYNTIGKVLQRKIKWNEGEINLEILQHEDSSALVVYNYHMNSNSSAVLSKWLQRHAEMVEVSQAILKILLEEN